MYHRDPEKRRAYGKAYYSANRDRVLARQRVYDSTHSNVDRMRKSRMKAFGLTPSDYDALLLAQGGVCKVCGATKPGGNGRFVVDHDHKTGKVRGLLCTRCNLMLGCARDDRSILSSASLYLRGAV